MTLTHLFRRWPLMLAALVLGAVAGLAVAKLQPPRYVATMTVSSVGPEDGSLTLGSSLSGGSGVLQAIKGITGAGGAGGANSDFGYFIALLHSDRTALQLANDAVALRQLFPTEWDPETRHWRRPQGWLSNLKAGYDLYFYGQAYVPPDVRRIKQRLNDVFAAQLDIETGSYLLSVKDRQCGVARSLLGAIFTTTDRTLKNEKRARFEENIKSLRSQLTRMENVQMQSQMADALLAQYLRRIAADSRLPLAARILDGPDCPPRPTLPLPIPYAIAGGLMAFVLILGWLALSAWRRAAAAADDAVARSV